MQSNYRHILGCVLIVVILTACGNHAPKEAKYIPKDANAVLVIDPKNLHDKMEKGGVNMDTLINRLFNRGGVDSADRTKFDQIKEAGINWNEKLYFLVQNPKTKNKILQLHST